MEKFKAFLKRKNIEISLKKYAIETMGAMAQGLFATLLIGTIINRHWLVNLGFILMAPCVLYFIIRVNTKSLR